MSPESVSWRIERPFPAVFATHAAGHGGVSLGRVDRGEEAGTQTTMWAAADIRPGPARPGKAGCQARDAADEAAFRSPEEPPGWQTLRLTVL